MNRALLVLALLVPACVPKTSFEGDAHFPGGPRACSAKCWGEELEMASFVYSGEFATACVCRPRPTVVVPGAPGSTSSSAADAGAEVAVIEAMRAREEAERHRASQQSMMHRHHH